PVCAFAAGAWSNPQERKVAGAAAKIADKDKFVVVECALVEVGRGDRFIFEDDGPDTSFIECAFQAADGELVVFLRIGIRVTNRPANHNRTVEWPRLFFGLNTQIAQHDRDEVFDRELPPIDTRAGKQPAS